MQQDLAEFRSLINSKRLANTPIFLLLNKIDIFVDLISVVPIRRTFPDFCRGSDCIDACEYFAGLFRQIDNRPNGKLYIHYTSAVDTESFAATLQDIALDLQEKSHPKMTPASENTTEKKGKNQLMKQIKRLRTSFKKQAFVLSPERSTTFPLADVTASRPNLTPGESFFRVVDATTPVRGIGTPPLPEGIPF